jgi:fibronectin-binding autotransporter adhesin
MQMTRSRRCLQQPRTKPVIRRLRQIAPLLAGLVLSGPITAPADILTTTNDVRTVPGSGNLAGNTELSLFNNGGNNIQRTWLNFDFSSYMGRPLASDATLTLKANTLGGAYNFLTGVSLGTANQAWSFTGITHENQPGITTVEGVINPDGSFNTDDSVNWTIPWYVVEKWAAGAYNGIALQSTPGSTLHFYSSRNGGTPTLTFDATASTNADGVWAGGDGNWSDTNPWADSIEARGVDRSATFNGATAVTATLDADRTIGALTFDGADHTLASGAGRLALVVSNGSPSVSVSSGRTAIIGVPLLGIDGLEKTGAGTLILSGASAFSGTMKVSVGTLQLGDGTSGHDGSIAPGGVVNDAALVYDLFGDQSPGYAIAGAGSVTKAGPGTLTLGGACSYSGSTTVSDGILRIASAFLADEATFSVAPGATADLAFAGADVVQAVVLGGVSQPAGFHNAATHPAFFSGLGSLLISPGERVWDGAVDSNWDDSTLNWNGLAWTNFASAVFTSSVGTISLAQPATAATMTFGTTDDNFTGGFAGSSLQVAGGLTARGWGGNDSGGPVLSFANDVAVGGEVSLGRRQLTVSAGTFTADRVVSYDSWGMFNVAGGAVTVSNGIDDSALPGGNTLRVTLTAGSLRAPYIKTTQAGWRGAGANSDGVELNGGTLIPSADTTDFIRMWDPGWGIRNQVMVGPGGAHIDTDGRDIAISRSLIDYNGAGVLTKTGSGMLTLAAINSFTGGTLVNGGILNLVAQSGGDGTIRGTVTVNAGAELRATGPSGAIFGYSTGPKIDTLNINGGLANTVGGVNHLWQAALNMAGGELRINGGVSDPNGNYYEWGNTAVYAGSHTNSAVISGRIRIRPDASPNVNFDVDSGPAAINLLVSAAITETGTSGITKKGLGVMRLTGASTYSGITVFEGGILDVADLPTYGVAGSLGQRAADGTSNVGLLFRGGTLRYSGDTPQSTDRGIRLSTTGGGGMIDASGSSPTATVSFTSSASADFFEDPGDRALTLTGSNTGSNLFAMAIGDAGGVTLLNKWGPGTWILSGANTYGGPTDVSEGALIVSGSTGTGAVTVAAGATLGGAGTIGGPVTSSGTIAPGASAGTLTIAGSLELIPGSSLAIELGGTAQGLEYDFLSVQADVTLDGNLEVSLINDFEAALAPGDLFTVLQSASAIGGVFDNVAPGGTVIVGSQHFTVHYGPTSAYGDDVVVLEALGVLAGGYDDWAVTNALVQGPEGDDDADGYANLIEYVTGANPTNADQIARLGAIRTNGLFAVRFTRDTDSVDATIVVEAASALEGGTGWTGLATNAAGSWGGSPGVSEAGTGSPVTVTVLQDQPAATNRFMRLRVTRP